MTHTVPLLRSRVRSGREASARRAALALWGLLALAGSARPASAQPASPDASPASPPLALTHATVVDVRDGRLLADHTVVVVSRRIVRVAPSARANVPPGARLIDARGLYVIPGLWDMHAHAPAGPPGDAMARQLFLPLHVANGVTGVRHMFGAQAELGQRDDVAARRTVGPRMVVGSPLVDGPRPMWGGSVRVGSPAEALEAVDSLAAHGYAFIKAYQFLARESYFGLLAAARRRRIPVAGHVPFAVTTAEAADSGQRSIEHLSGILLACSAQEGALRDTLAAAAAAVDTSFVAHTTLWARAETAPAATFTRAKCEALARRIAQRGTWVTPTLVVHRAFAGLGDAAFRASADNRARAAYLPAFFGRLWAGVAGAYPGYHAAYARHREAVGILHRAGVPLLAGTDVLNPYLYPGFSLHDELALLQAAGLAPLEALRTATLNPARYFGATDSLGTVAPGKVADLLLVDADPLADVRNARRIRAVVLDGRYLDRAALDSLLAGVRRAANPAAAPGR